MSKDAKLLRFYSILAGLIFLTALLAPFILTQDPYESSMQQAFLPPSAEHWFGTDKLGRDLFTRVIYGARISVFMSLTVVILIAGIGSAIGVVAGYVGGKVDTIIMRLADMFLAFPGIVLAIAIAGMMGGSVVNAILALVAVGWTKYARLARSRRRRNGDSCSTKAGRHCRRRRGSCCSPAPPSSSSSPCSICGEMRCAIGLIQTRQADGFTMSYDFRRLKFNEKVEEVAFCCHGGVFVRGGIRRLRRQRGFEGYLARRRDELRGLS